jgi:hypothetical protein
MKRFYGYLYERDDCITIALLPRIRLTVGSSVGLGFQWLTCWLHVWLWDGVRRDSMIELTPHVWLYLNPRHGVYLHLQWLKSHKTWHVYKRQTTEVA